MKSRLKTKFAGVDMPNPFMLSSAPPTGTVEMVARAFEAGWGGAVLKTMAYEHDAYENVMPRISSVKLDNEIVGFTNFELGSPQPIEQWVKDVNWLKTRFPDRAVFVSLLHTEGLIESQWKEVAKMFDESKADGFELNFSCSHGMAEGGGGASIGSDIHLIDKVTNWVKGETDKPIIVKIPAIIDNIPEKARAAESAGANAISSINTLNSLPKIDIDTFVPFPGVDGYSAFQGMSGSTIKPIALRTVAQIAKAVDIPVSGMGGITDWEDAVQFILAGSSSVQVCSAVMIHGYRIIEDLTAGLANYMEEKGFESIDDFCGISLPYLQRHNDLSRDYKLIAKIDEDICVGCGRCIAACDDSGYQAIEFDENRKYAIVDKEECDGCGLCHQICPVDGTIEMVRK